MTTPTMPPVPDYGWPVSWTPDSTEYEQVERAEAYAALTMRMLTAYRVGGHPITVMPCVGTHSHGFTPTLIQGRMYNTRRIERWVALDPPVGRVDQVRVDGEVLDPSAYRIEDGNRLVRTDGGEWPSVTSDDFTVTYLNAYPVDGIGALVAGILAKEFLNALTGNRCRLPANVTGITRQGVSMDLTTGLFPGGYTGITEVDAYIRQWNPEGLKVAPSVHSPDVHRQRRVTWSAT